MYLWYTVNKRVINMTQAKLKTLSEMKKVSESKKNYGLNQLNKDTLSESKVYDDPKAIYGKKVLKDKIYCNA